MKIAHLTTNSSSNGGVGAYVVRLSREQVRAGHEVIVIYGEETSLENERITQYQVENFQLFRHANPHATEKILEILKKEQVEIAHIHANNNFKLEDAIRSSFPVLKSLHVHDFCPSGGKFHHATQKICKKPTSAKCLPYMISKRCTLSKNPKVIWDFYKRAKKANLNNQKYHKVLVASRYVKEEALRSGYPDALVEVLPYFADQPEPSDVLVKKYKIAFVGRILPDKGLESLLRALSLVDDEVHWELVVNGDGPDLIKMMGLSNRLRIADRVKFVGWLDQEEHLKLYEEVAFVCVPSVWPEPFGLVGIEAMSYGKPVIAFRVGGIPDWLEDGKTGYLINPYDAAEMAKKIELLLTQDQTRTKMGLLAYEKYTQEFVARKHVEKLTEIYNEVIVHHA